jgi:hypothetical protein
MRTTAICSAGAVAVLCLLPSAALADATYPPAAPSTPGVLQSGDTVGGTTRERPATPAGPSTLGLPFTGAEVTLLALAGAVALGAGTLVLVGARRRSPDGPV